MFQFPGNPGHPALATTRVGTLEQLKKVSLLAALTAHTES
jgi:hypothetical protein